MTQTIVPAIGNLPTEYSGTEVLDGTVLAVPNISWSPSEEAQKIGTWVGVAIVFAWFIFIVAQFAFPKKNGGRGRVSVVGLIFSLVIAVLCMDLTLIPPVINVLIDGANGLVDLVKSINT